MEEFPKFGVVTDFSDHSFADSPSNLGTFASSAVMSEWKSLQKNLPSSMIYVRVYEGRLDLLRAAIVGAQKTPYHDGLFFFDFQFPPNYPFAPPKARYLSFGLRPNPNLYQDGSVCLSVLNTCDGPVESDWRPAVTILQLLVSIQGLVLNDAGPFFNDPTRPLIWKKAGASKYNQRVFVLSCKTMVRVLRRPPRNFDILVIQHFRARARAILAACQAYIYGFSPVGEYEYVDGGRFTSEKQRIRMPEEVEYSMRKQYAALYATLLLLRVLSEFDCSLIEFSENLELMVDDALKESLPPPPPVSKLELIVKLFERRIRGVVFGSWLVGSCRDFIWFTTFSNTPPINLFCSFVLNHM